MPQLGESMAEATIVAIKVKPGDKVSADQEIIEVETDKAVMGVTTPCAGEIAKIDAEVKGTYAVGTVLGYVEASEADAARFQKRAPQPPKGEVAKGNARSRRGDHERPTEAARISKSMKQRLPQVADSFPGRSSWRLAGSRGSKRRRLSFTACARAHAGA